MSDPLRSVGWVIWDEKADKLGSTPGGSSTRPATKVYPTKARALAYGYKGAREVFIKQQEP